MLDSGEAMGDDWLVALPGLVMIDDFTFEIELEIEEDEEE